MGHEGGGGDPEVVHQSQDVWQVFARVLTKEGHQCSQLLKQELPESIVAASHHPKQHRHHLPSHRSTTQSHKHSAVGPDCRQAYGELKLPFT